MNTQRALSQHSAHLSVPRLGKNSREGLRQDKSRKVLGGWTGRKSRNNNVRGKGAHGSITLLNAVIRLEVCELCRRRLEFHLKPAV